MPLRKRRLVYTALCWLLLAMAAHAEHWTLSAVENSTLTRLAQAIVRPAYAELGITIEVHEYPPMRALRYSNNGLVDGELYRVRGIEAQYTNLIPVPEPLLTGDIVAFTLDPALADHPITGHPDARVLIRRGVISHDLATRGMNREIVDSYEQMISMLQAGRAHFGVFSRIHTWVSLQGASLDDVYLLATPLSHFELMHYVNARHADRVDDIAAAMRYVHDSGLTEQIMQSLEEAPESFE
ncbi:MAG: hypothetical protein ACX931_07480 [Saccharospirillum sp.]